MKFGVLQFFSWTRRIPLEEVYARAFDRIAIMDEGGYDAVWLAEHHFNTYSVCPSVCLMGTHIAARTKRLRIGTAVTLAAYYHPLRLAEELAMLDHFSGGRLNWGAGRGFDPVEFRAFGIPAEESAARFMECVAIVQEAWKVGRFSFAGKYWQFEEIEVLPKPLQQPQPPVWLAASSPEAIERAAAGGYSILMDPHASNADIGRKRALYGEALERAGHSPQGREIPTARLIALGETTREAREAAAAGARWMVGSYVKGHFAGGRDPIEHYLDDVVIHGTPAAVVDRLVQLRDEIGLDYLMAAPLSHRSFLLFTEQVLPRLL
jgi:alkanesulfonate monooxygenase SsuD/methylene tetrahydromethanopterin reductase-like flavin-dependent oxidoreductase (luciferase family)